KKLVIPAWLGRFVAGAALATLILVPLASLRLRGQDSWVAFVHNSEKHLNTPVLNNMGLKSVIAYDPNLRSAITFDSSLPDTWGKWKQTQRDTFARRKPLFWLLVAAALVLFGAALATEAPWVALALGGGLILIVAQITCYYLVVLLLLALLDERLPWASAALALAAAVSDLIPLRWLREDDSYVLTSEWWLAIVVLIAGGLLLESRRRALLPEPEPPKKPAKAAKVSRARPKKGRRR
ncbi:MAG TPA: hypothetical protein VIA18_07380, partial [Polyangia bacterium]|nr:hypothetical protein [Polyangia bacterium]